MKCTTLTVAEKKQILHERRRRLLHNETATQTALAPHENELELSKCSGKTVMLRIWNDSKLPEEDKSFHNLSQSREPKNAALERAPFDWLCEMCCSGKCISAAMIQADAHQLSQKSAVPFQSQNKYCHNFPTDEATNSKTTGIWYHSSYTARREMYTTAPLMHISRASVKSVAVLTKRLIQLWQVRVGLPNEPRSYGCNVALCRRKIPEGAVYVSRLQ